MNIALLSPSENSYSETFIQNHKNNFIGNVFYYYKGIVPTHLEGKGKLKHSIIDEFIFFLRKLRGRDISYELLNTKTLIRSLKENKIDLVYAEFGITGAEAIGICKEAKIPLIVNFHGADSSVKSILKDYTYKYQELFQFAKKIIAVSEDMRNRLIEMGCPEEKVIYIANAASSTFLEVKPQYSEEAFLCIGRFVDKKAPYYNILSFQKVIKQFPDAKLYMIGDGPLFETCRNLVNKLGLENNVILLGIQPQNVILEFCSRVKGYVQHSITSTNGDVEGMPIAVLEASAAGLPVISTKHAGIPDVIIHEKTGFIVKEHDVDGIADYMIRILEEENLAQEMGSLGKENIKNNFSFDKHINAINDIIAEYAK